MDLAVLDARAGACALDPLYAVGALLHHAAAAHRDLWVARHGERLARPVGVEVVVEAADLVRTVVRAVARPDAAVVDHVVEALAAVHGGVHRADDLTGRVLAVHAGHRLVQHLGGVQIAGEVAVDAQPLHLAAPRHLVLPDDGDVVLGDAGRDAGVAADASVEIDRHAPRIAEERMLVRVEGLRARGHLDHLTGELRVGAELREGRAPHQGPTFHAVVILGAGERVARARLPEREAGAAVERVARPQRAGVEADVAPDAARLGPAEAERDRHAVRRLAGHHPDRRVHAPAADAGRTYVLAGEPEARRGRRRD